MDAAVERSANERALEQRFYRASLTESEQRLLDEAYAIEGLDHEIAVLRVKLRSAIAADPDNLKLILQGMGMLVRMAAARYRMSPKSRKDLADNMAAVLNSLGDLLLPPDAVVPE